jgi:hypothetical protein
VSVSQRPRLGQTSPVRKPNFLSRTGLWSQSYDYCAYGDFLVSKTLAASVFFKVEKYLYVGKRTGLFVLAL